MSAGRGAWAVWITGAPAAGKSALARALLARLASLGLHAVHLESDVLRPILSPDAGYSAEGRDRFYAALARLAAELVRQGFPVVVDATASRRSYREEARALLPGLVEVYVETPLAVREARDPKGLYRLAREGRAPLLPGVGEPYEEPRRPDLILSGTAPLESSVDTVLSALGAPARPQVLAGL